MKKIDDEILMAYVDSELGEEERKDVEAALANDPEARRKVDEYRTTRAAIDQFADILDEPVPDHLISAIRQNAEQSNVVKLSGRPKTGRGWFAIAASLVVGISLGTFATYKALDQSHNDETTLAESKIGDLSKALEIARAERKKAEEKIAASNVSKPATTLASGIENIFPSRLVAEAIENGSGLSADEQKRVLAELNRESLTTEASQYESLSDLQPTDTEGAKSQNQIETRDTVALATINKRNTLGEFSYAGQTCRLFKDHSQSSFNKLILLACKKGTGFWEIIQKRP
jgi:hypothetical protein